MAIPTIQNLSGLEIGYTVTQVPAVLIGCSLYDSLQNNVDVTLFQYVRAADLLPFTSSSTQYCDTWSFTNAPGQNTLYVRLTRQSSSVYVIGIYNDSSYTTLLATGTGSISSVITFTEYSGSYSGINGSVNKNATALLNDGDTFSFTLSSTTVWKNATVLANTQATTGLQTKTTGRAYSFYWDVKTDLPATTNESYYFRIQVQESGGGDSSLIECIPNITVLLQSQTYALTVASYTNQRTYYFGINVTVGTATKYRVSETLSTLTAQAWQSISNNLGSIYFSTSTQELKTFYIQVSDSYFNISGTQTSSITYLTTAPNTLYLSLTGSSGNTSYTGVVVNSDGSFTLSDAVTGSIYAESLTSMYYYIDGDVKDGANIRTWLPFEASNNSFTAHLMPANNLYLGNDTNNTVKVTFKDLAGNTASISDTIQFNTKIFNLSHKNLMTPTSSYDHQIMEVATTGDSVVLPRQATAVNSYVRMWNDIFYPTSHSYPTNSDGSINVSAAIAMGGISNANNDAVLLNSGAIVYDSNGLTTTTNWTSNGTKNYLNMESSYETVNGQGFRYWVIDNTGYGEFSLQFEQFHLDSNSYGPPFNQIYSKGDALVIYDASAEGCCTPTISAYGQTTWTLTDSSLLTELYAYTGDGSNVFSRTTGALVNADTNGGFTTPTITTTTRICMILYTDAAITNSGFKLKGGPQHSTTWSNWQMDELNGQLWIHSYPTGASTTLPVRAIYTYYNSRVDVDCDNGTVTFDTALTGNVTGTYSYYGYNVSDTPPSLLFAAYNDDFVDYADASFYVSPVGVTPSKSELYQPPTSSTYPVPVHSTGKITSQYTLDTDRGILQFSDGTSTFSDKYGYVPRGRVFGDYQYHTYYRLTNDGYGDFTFHDLTLVADNTPSYPDYTFGDIKIVNEGSAILEAGQMQFLPRGYDTNGDGVIEQVLDINRPWDVQQGTPAETYNVAACDIETSYIWSQTCTKAQAESILSTWKGKAFGFNVSPQQVFYGRVVWVLGGTSGSSYPTTTSGSKAFSSEIQGKFYSITT